MHKFAFLLSVITVCAVSCGEIKVPHGLPETRIEQCINRISYTKSGRWDFNLYGRRLLYLQFDYLENASPEENKNCILSTIKSYTEQFGTMHFNLDRIPTVVFDQVLSVIKEKNGGRYKRSIYHVIENVYNIDLNQMVNGNNNRAVQLVYANGQQIWIANIIY